MDRINRAEYRSRSFVTSHLSKEDKGLVGLTSMGTTALQAHTVYSGELVPDCETGQATNTGAIQNILHQHRESVGGRSWCKTSQGAAAIAKDRVGRKLNWTPRMSLDRIIMEGQLGVGAYGMVWSATLADKTPVAIKQLGVYSRPQCKPEDAWKERDILISLQGSRVVRLLGAFFEGDAFLVLELCSGSLRHLINGLNSHARARFCVQLLQGLEHIHKLGVIHVDLRPENLLVTSMGQLVFSDFGSSFVLKKDKEVVQTDRLRSVPGYSDFYSLSSHLYSKSTDVFAAGCVMFELSVGRSLLQYPANNSGSNDEEFVAEYIRCHLEGRVKRMSHRVLEANKERESLCHRATQDLVWGHVIQKMIMLPARKRLTPSEILLSEDFRIALGRAKLTKDTIDNGDDIANPTVSPCVKIGFSTMTPNTSELAVLWAAFYFDVALLPVRAEWATVPVPFEAHCLAKYLMRTGLIDEWAKAVAVRNPIAIGALRMSFERSLTDQPDERILGGFSDACVGTITEPRLEEFPSTTTGFTNPPAVGRTRNASPSSIHVNRASTAAASGGVSGLSGVTKICVSPRFPKQPSLFQDRCENLPNKSSKMAASADVREPKRKSKTKVVSKPGSKKINNAKPKYSFFDLFGPDPDLKVVDKKAPKITNVEKAARKTGEKKKRDRVQEKPLDLGGRNRQLDRRPDLDHGFKPKQRPRIENLTEGRGLSAKRYYDSETESKEQINRSRCAFALQDTGLGEARRTAKKRKVDNDCVLDLYKHARKNK